VFTKLNMSFQTFTTSHTIYPSGPPLYPHTCVRGSAHQLLLLLPSHIGTLSNIILARSSSIILMKQKKVFHEFSCLRQKCVGGGRGQAKWENLHFI
jgi:hypothetical protein